MKQEFVPYELALKLKELGFEKECLAYYSIEKGFEKEFRYAITPYQLELLAQAPTFSQAFRWFRNQGFFVSFSTHNYNIHDFYIKWSMPESTTLSESILSDAYDTYEETELACLEKLIEILERKGAYVTSDRKK
jgi:hypothetical protein